jgi:hypothetical protein
MVKYILNVKSCIGSLLQITWQEKDYNENCA